MSGAMRFVQKRHNVECHRCGRRTVYKIRIDEILGHSQPETMRGEFNLPKGWHWSCEDFGDIESRYYQRQLEWAAVCPECWDKL